MLISKEYRFEASHVLPKHSGKCARLHGHSYVLKVSLVGRVNEQTGFVMDYGELSQLLNPLIDLFDHHHLNDILEYPSAENLALLFAGILCPLITANSQSIFRRLSVEVSETSKTTACFDLPGATFSYPAMLVLANARTRWNQIIKGAENEIVPVPVITNAADCTITPLGGIYQDYIVRLRDTVNALQNSLIDMVCEGGAYNQDRLI